MEYFKFTDKVKYEGKDSKNPMAFRYYNKDRVVLGKKMSEHLPFAMLGGTLSVHAVLICSAQVQPTRALTAKRQQWLTQRLRLMQALNL